MTLWLAEEVVRIGVTPRGRRERPHATPEGQRDVPAHGLTPLPWLGRWRFSVPGAVRVALGPLPAPLGCHQPGREERGWARAAGIARDAEPRVSSPAPHPSQVPPSLLFSFSFFPCFSLPG